MRTSTMNWEAYAAGMKAFLEKNRDSLTVDEVKLFGNIIGVLESSDKVKPGLGDKLREIAFGQLLRFILNPEMLEKLGGLSQ